MQVRATATIAAVFNLEDISIPFALEGRSANSSVYLGLAAQSWCVYYGHQLMTSCMSASMTPRG